MLEVVPACYTSKLC